MASSNNRVLRITEGRISEGLKQTYFVNSFLQHRGRHIERSLRAFAGVPPQVGSIDEQHTSLPALLRCTMALRSVHTHTHRKAKQA